MTQHTNNQRYSLPQPRIYTDSYGRKMIDGETWFGGIRVPMLPNRIALRDLSTGDYKVLSHSGDPLVISLVDINPNWSDVTRADAWYSGFWTLTLTGGVLAFTEGTIEYNAGLILTRRGYDRTMLQLTPNTNDGSVIYTDYTV